MLLARAHARSPRRSKAKEFCSPPPPPPLGSKGAELIGAENCIRTSTSQSLGRLDTQPEHAGQQSIQPVHNVGGHRRAKPRRVSGSFPDKLDAHIKQLEDTFSADERTSERAAAFDRGNVSEVSKGRSVRLRCARLADHLRHNNRDLTASRRRAPLSSNNE